MPLAGRHAVVVGGSMAGMLAARALTDHFERVTVRERDPLPEAPVPQLLRPPSALFDPALAARAACHATARRLFRSRESVKS